MLREPAYGGLVSYGGGSEVEEYDDDWDDQSDRDDPDREPAPPAWFPGGHLPLDARRMGLSHHVGEGALLDFAGKLDGAKAWHRAAAWFMLVVFGLPVVFAILRLWHVIVG
jgi:hypothetical protein